MKIYVWLNKFIIRSCRVLKNKRIRPHQLNKNRKEKPEKPNRDQNSNKISKKQNNKKFVPKLNCPLVKMGQSRSLRTKLEIDETMPLEVLSEEIRFRIWEQKRWMLKELVEEMGPAVAIEIVNEVSEIEKRVILFIFIPLATGK
jgi:hypothetical protein